MNINEILHQVSISALPLILALTLPEYAYGWMAQRLGDPTPKMMGRLSLDPMKHIDPLWSIVMPLVCLLSGSPLLIGNAKPMPINYNNFKPGTIRKSMGKIGIAGVAGSWLLALIWGIISLIITKVFSGGLASFIIEMGTIAVGINLSFMALRLLPIPGTMGAKILISVLPPELARKYAELEPYGFYIFLLLIITGIASLLMKPLMILGGIPIAIIMRTFG